MIEEKKIKNILEGIIDDSEIFIVDIEIKPTNKINIEIDKMEGIKISECAKISREIEKNLDREEEDFELIVSSPGLTKPFKVLEQYKKNIGKKINVITNENKDISGLLKDIYDNKIIIDKDPKKKDNNEQTEISINIKEIKKAILIIPF